MWATVDADRDFAGDVLLSSELFGRMGREAFERIDALAAGMGRELRILCHLRHPAALASSATQQRLKTNEITLEAATAEPPVRRNAAYVRAMIEVVGREEGSHAGTFEAACEHGGAARPPADGGICRPRGPHSRTGTG